MDRTIGKFILCAILSYNKFSVCIIYLFSLFITKTGKVFSCGWGADGQTGLGHYNNESQPTVVEGDIKGEIVVKVVSSADCVLALNGKLFVKTIFR